jgi:Protein of unknown function (DUF3078)
MIKILLFSFLLISIDCLSQSDTLHANSQRTTSQLFRSNLSTSFLQQSNTTDNDFKSVSFVGNLFYKYNVKSETLVQNYETRANLGFTKYLDSLWQKVPDDWRITAFISEKPNKKIEHTYAAKIRSQFLHSYIYRYEDDTIKKIWKGGFFNPATFQLAYGFNYHFWDYCFVNVSFAAFNIYAKPIYSGVRIPEDQALFKNSKRFIVSEYGFSFESSIQKEIYKNVIWENSSEAFINGINKQQIDFSIYNCITVKFLKYLHFRTTHEMRYDPLNSYKVENRLELLLGFLYEFRKKK